MNTAAATSERTGGRRAVAAATFLLSGLLACAAPARAAEETPAPAVQPAASATAVVEPGFKSDDPKYADADEALNEARANLGDAASARQRITRLQGVLARYADYKYRADAFYFIGLNAQYLGENKQAVDAFESALRAEPEIANETPIVSYLRAVKSQVFLQVANVLLLVLLAAILLPALLRLTRADAATLPWKRLFAVYAIAAVAWTALVFLLPALLGALKSGLDPFPKPVLSEYCLGQIGDEPLRALLGYGLGAILATLPIIAATARISRPGTRRALTSLGVLSVIGALMGLYGIRYLYVNARYQGDSRRVVFLVRSVDSMQDVPDAMLPLYEKDFRQRVLESRKRAKK